MRCGLLTVTPADWHRAARTRPGLVCAGLVGLWLAIGAVCPAHSQVVVTTVEGAEAEEKSTPTGFGLPLADHAILDAYEDFGRYCRRQAWEKAFRALSTMSENKSKGLVGASGGFYVPYGRRVWQDLTALSAEGKRAYRLFNNAKAQRLLEQARHADQAGQPDEIITLKKLFDIYFITSAGDDAADRLGDAEFEAGRFDAAARYWQAILECHPDTDLSMLRLHVKRAIALARAGAWNEFDQTLRLVRERFASETMKLGGKDVVVSEYLDTLARAREKPQDVPGSEASGPIVLPETDTPVWQIKFLGPSTVQSIKGVLQNQGWGGRGHWLGTVVPASAVCDGRVYVNWLGICFALDEETGKLLWRTARFDKLNDKFQQMIWQLDADRYAVAAGGDRLLAIGIAMDKIGHHQEPFRLSCLDGQTGKIRWKSESVQALKDFSFTGKPLVVDQAAYAIAHKKAQKDLQLLALNIEDGNLAWQLEIGTPGSTGTNRYGRPKSPKPVLLHRNGYLYVLTNAGAVICVDSNKRQIEWAFTYEVVPPTQDRQMWGWAWQGTDPPLQTPGTEMVCKDVLYFKDAQAEALYALDLSATALKWRRPVSKSEMLACSDGRFVYVLGRELSAIDAETRRLRWSTKLPVATGNLQVAVAGNHLYVFGSRGIFEIDKTNGDVEHIFRGADLSSVGGVLWRVGERLFSVSNLAVTAYRHHPAQERNDGESADR